MDKLDIVIWMMGAGFSVMFTLMLIMWHSMNSKFEKIDEKFEKLDARVGGLDTKLAVVESKLGDVSTNVTHLMWQHQIPKEARDIKEQ